MRAKPVVPREQADRDVEAAVAYYVTEHAGAAALDFIGALQGVYSHIGRYPGAGSPRYAHDLNLPGLRCVPLARFPCLVFYVERTDHIDVWRILHVHRDLPASVRGPEEA